MSRSLTPQSLKKLDSSNMLDLLLDFPGQCAAALDMAKRTEILFKENDFNKVVFAGMGGSAVGSDVIKAYSYLEMKIPVLVLREYLLPAYIDGSTLLFLSSYSGNTDETLSAYRQARKTGASLVAISSGGRLQEYALKDKITFIQVPGGLPARYSLGYSSIIPLCLLAKLGLIKDVTPSINNTIRQLEDLRNTVLNPRLGPKDNIAKQLASSLLNKIVFIYAASLHFGACARRLKNQLSENSKAIAFVSVLPEASHNEVMGWQNPQKLFKHSLILMLRDKDMHPATAKGAELAVELIKKEGVKVLEIWSGGCDLLSKIFSLIYIGDFVSYYLAMLYGVDPTPVERITYLKEQLSK